jgi:hypothetical protein
MSQNEMINYFQSKIDTAANFEERKFWANQLKVVYCQVLKSNERIRCAEINRRASSMIYYLILVWFAFLVDFFSSAMPNLPTLHV